MATWKQLENSRMVRPHPPSRAEITLHLSVADRDLRDAEVPELSDDGKFRMAYSAAYQLSTIALFASGYEAERLVEPKCAGDLHEGRLHPLADDENNLIDSSRAIESFPRMGHERTTIQFQEQLIDVCAHAGALAGGDNNGRSHFGSAPRQFNTLS